MTMFVIHFVKFWWRNKQNSLFWGALWNASQKLLNLLRKIATIFLWIRIHTSLYLLMHGAKKSIFDAYGTRFHYTYPSTIVYFAPFKNKHHRITFIMISHSILSSFNCSLLKEKIKVLVVCTINLNYRLPLLTHWRRIYLFFFNYIVISADTLIQHTAYLLLFTVFHDCGQIWTIWSVWQIL